jgi:RNA polymerase sigma-70 factor, ECF subfamily
MIAPGRGEAMAVDTVEEEIGAKLDAGDFTGAATAALKAYGPGILGYLASIVQDDGDADEVFSSFCEDLWRGIAKFRRECSVKTWAYRLAVHAAMRFLSSPYRKRVRRLRTSEASNIADELRVKSSGRMLSVREAGLSQLRQKLDPEERTLLILRVDRRLPWKDIALVMSADGEPPIDSAALRKRYERLTHRLRALAREQGLLSS